MAMQPGGGAAAGTDKAGGTAASGVEEAVGKFEEAVRHDDFLHKAIFLTGGEGGKIDALRHAVHGVGNGVEQAMPPRGDYAHGPGAALPPCEQTLTPAGAMRLPKAAILRRIDSRSQAS